MQFKAVDSIVLYQHQRDVHVSCGVAFEADRSNVRCEYAVRIAVLRGMILQNVSKKSASAKSAEATQLRPKRDAGTSRRSRLQFFRRHRHPRQPGRQLQ